MQNSDSQQNVLRSSKLARVAVGCWALIAFVAAYVLALLVANAQSLALVAGALSSLTLYVGYRIFLRRFSVAWTVLGIPALVALLCLGWLRLTPLRHRQSSFDALRRANIGFTSKNASISGEWMMTRSGTVVPKWLGSVVGPECLAELTSIDGRLEDFGALERRSIDTSKLERIRFKGSSSSELTEELVDWLNCCPSLETLFLEFDELDGGPFELLEKEWHASIRVTSSDTSLSSLGAPRFIEIGGNLTRSQVADLCSIGSYQKGKSCYLQLSLSELKPEIVAALAGLPPEHHLAINGSKLESETLTALANLGRPFLALDNVTFAQSPRIDSSEVNANRTQYLSIQNFSPNEEQLLLLARLFRCDQLTIGYPRGVAESEIQKLWKSTELQSLKILESGWKTFSRPTNEQELAN